MSKCIDLVVNGTVLGTRVLVCFCFFLNYCSIPGSLFVWSKINQTGGSWKKHPCPRLFLLGELGGAQGSLVSERLAEEEWWNILRKLPSLESWDHCLLGK